MPTDSYKTKAWDRARELFLDLAERSRVEREAQLEALGEDDPQLAAWVRSLLAEDDAFEDPTAPLGVAHGAQVPKRFGPYEVVRSIAVGGMGEVLLGRRSDGEFERVVAIKRLRPGFGSELVRRFQRERQTLATLEHERIARLIDGGTTDEGEPYLILEYVPGRSIDAFCDEEELGIRERIELLRSVLDAVSYAHERGVVHRDLKPKNILVREDGEPRLLDFGIARPLRRPPEETQLTGTGQRLFTPEYASPEQVRGEAVGPESDQFSLGVLLYRLLAGVSPWGSCESLHQLEERILEQDPLPPSRHRTGWERRLLLGDLDTIVLRCLAKDPRERLESVAELSAELGRHLEGVPIRTRPIRWYERFLRHARRNPWQAVAAVVLLAALAAGGAAWRAEDSVRRSEEARVEQLYARLEHAMSLSYQDQNAASADELEAILVALEGVEVDPRFRVEVETELVDVLVRLGRNADGLARMDESLARFPADRSVWVEPRIAMLAAAIVAHNARGHGEQAEAAAMEAYQLAGEFLPRGHRLRIQAIEGVALQRVFSLEERIAMLGDAVLEAREREKPNDGALGSVLTSRATLLIEHGDFDAALADLDESLAIDRWHHGESHGDVAMVRQLKGRCFLGQRRFEEARVELQAALETFRTTGHDRFVPLTESLLEQARAQLGLD